MNRAGLRVGVTGAGGFIGRHLVAALAEAGHDVAAWTAADADLTSAPATTELLARDRPDVVFHLAAAGARPGGAHSPEALVSNVAMTVNLVEAAPPGTVLVTAGTMAEYGRGGVLSENDACVPNTAYALGKYAAGAYAARYGPGRGLTVRVARLFGIYGPGEHPDRLFPSLVRRLAEGREVPLSDGRQRRDFVHVRDAVEALIRIGTLSSAGPLVVNVGTGQAVAVRDACRWIAATLGADERLLAFGARERSPGDADLLEADTTRLRDLTGWVPPQRLRPGLPLDLVS